MKDKSNRYKLINKRENEEKIKKDRNTVIKMKERCKRKN